MRLALTGGIGCGVSLAASRFAELGARIISADEAGHEVLRHPDVVRKLLEIFGSDILNSAHQIDRKYLAGVIFSNEEARKQLNRIVHPALLDLVAQQARAAEAAGEVAIVDAALIYEWSAQGFFHKVIVVNATLENRLQRITERDGLDRDQALARINAQIPLEKKVERADYVIENNGTPEELYRQVEAIWREIMAG